MTPHDIHPGAAAAKSQQRAEEPRAAYAAHPERFPRCGQYWAKDLVVQAALARVRERAATNESWDGVERPGKG